jgi:hypothetical protein
MSRGCRRPWAPLKSHGQPEDHGIGVCWSHNKPVGVSRCQSKSGTGSVYCCVPRDFWRHRARSDLTEIRARQSARVRVQIKVDVNRVRSERAALSGYLGVGQGVRRRRREGRSEEVGAAGNASFNLGGRRWRWLDSRRQYLLSPVEAPTEPLPATPL